ncbi:MAG: glycosyltransferase family 2 protein [Cytophagales bacterium]|nr:glycosyltransferase family 2 protein [Cytophagales bacterium]
MNKSKIYILLPVHNRKEITYQFIDCLKQQTCKNYHLLLIDDGSIDGTSEMVKENIDADKLTEIRGMGNWWWAGSLQKGYKWLLKKKINPDDYVLIINDDCILENNFLETGMSLLEKHPKTLIQAIALIAGQPDNEVGGIHADWKNLSFNQAKDFSEINCLSTRGLFLRFCDFIEIGGFYPKLLRHYTSDYEFTIRAFSKGFRLMTNHSLKLTINDSAAGGLTLDYKKSSWPFLKILLSRKYTENPIMWSMFILLSCPWKWKLVNIYKVWFRSLIIFMNYFKVRLYNLN